MDEKRLFAHLAKLQKPALLGLLRDAFDEMNTTIPLIRKDSVYNHYEKEDTQ